MTNKEVYIKLTGDYSGRIDLDGSQALPLEISATDIRDFTKKTGVKSYPFKAAGTKNNRQVISTLPVEKSISCELIEDGVAIMENAVLRVMGTVEKQSNSNDDQELSYNLMLRDLVSEFFAEMGDDELTDLEFGELNHQYTSANVVASFDHTDADGYKYIMPLSDGNTYNLTEWRPGLYCRPILKKICAAHGFSYEWDTETSENTRFDKWIVPYNGDVPKQSEETLAQYRVEAEKTTVQALTGTSTAGSVAAITATHITVPTEISDPAASYNPATSVYTSPLYYIGGGAIAFECVVEWEVFLNNTSGATAYLVDITSSPVTYTADFKPVLSLGKGANLTGSGVGNMFTGDPLGRIQVTEGASYAAGETIIGGGVTTVNFAPALTNQNDTYRIAAYVSAGSFSNNLRWKDANSVSGNNVGVNTGMRVKSLTLKISPSMSEIGYNQTVFMNEFVPKKFKQADFVRAIFTHQNVIAVPDRFQPRKLILKNRDNFYDSGNVVDLDKVRIDKSKEQTREYLSAVSTKRVIWTYKDDEDEPNAAYRAATNETYGQLEFVYDTEHEKGTEIKEIAFSPTPCTENSHGAIVSMLNGVAPKTNLRLVLDGGNYECGEYTIVDYYDSSVPFAPASAVGVTLSEYPHTTHFDRPFNPTFDVNFGSNPYLYYQPGTIPNNTAFNIHWRRTANQVNKGELLTASFYITPSFVEDMRLNDKYYLNGEYWNLNKLQYNGTDDGSYKMELVTADDMLALPVFRSKKPVFPFIGDLVLRPGKHIGGLIREFSNIILTNFPVTIFGKNNTVSGSVKAAVVMGDGNTVNTEKAMVIGDGIDADEPGVYTPMIEFPDGTQLRSLNDIPDNTILTMDDVQDADRAHEGGGFTLLMDNTAGWTTKGTSTQGASDVVVTVESKRSTNTYTIFKVKSAAGDAMEVKAGLKTFFYGDTRTNGNAGFGDDAQSNFKVHMYANNAGLAATLNVSADTLTPKAAAFTSSAVNGAAVAAAAQGSGGTGITMLGAAVGGRATVTNGAATAFEASGALYVETHGLGSSRAASAVLEAKSTTQGVLFSRMTTSQKNAISAISAAEYLMVTDTDKARLFSFMNSNWYAHMLEAYVAKTATYTATIYDRVIDCDGTFTVTLMDAATVQARELIVKNSGTGTITVGTTSSQTIDGATTKVLNVQYAFIRVVSDGANWKVIG